jgi:hypothetical protein
MASIFQKLNLKTQSEIVVFNVPASFKPELAQLESVKIVRNPKNPPCSHTARVAKYSKSPVFLGNSSKISATRSR